MPPPTKADRWVCLGIMIPCFFRFLRVDVCGDPCERGKGSDVLARGPVFCLFLSVRLFHVLGCSDFRALGRHEMRDTCPVATLRRR